MSQPQSIEQDYERALLANPRQPAIWRALGEVRFKRKQLTEAQAAYESSLRLDGKVAATHFGMAAVCKEQGRAKEAIASYRMGLTIDPKNVEATLALGMLLAGQGQTNEAIELWRKVAEKHPEHYQAIHNLGVAFAQQGDAEESIRHFSRALAIKPNYAEAHYNLGNVLNDTQGHGKRPEESAPAGTKSSRRQEAVQHYLAAIRIRPGYAEAYHNLGALLTELGRPVEAVVWLKQAVRLCQRDGLLTGGKGDRAAPTRKDEKAAPTRVPALEFPSQEDFLAHSSLSSALNQLGLALGATARYREAERCYNRALDQKPDLADLHSNLGNLFQEQGRLPEALASYELAMALDPQSTSTRWNRALSLLQVGNYEVGWREYEWRWKRNQTPPRPFEQPRWDGSRLEGRTLLIYMEQGLGDILQFIRYAALARERVGRVIVEFPYFVLPLLQRCPGVDEVIPEGKIPLGNGSTGAGGAGLPKFDVQIPLMSLPAALGTTLKTIPNQVPYLFVEESRVQQWCERLRALKITRVKEDDPSSGISPSRPPFVVGIVWQGNPNHRFDRYRSVKLGEFAVLARVPGVVLVNLQRGPGVKQLDEMETRIPVWNPPIVEEMNAEALLDTAALMKNLDLVISVDTGTAHLAGGLGVPVWLPLSAIGEWRWLLGREDTPWYPNARLFRQSKLGEWRPVFRRMAKELKALRSANYR